VSRSSSTAYRPGLNAEQHATSYETISKVYVALFHSMVGLRAVELAAAEQLRATGCQVVLPDLFAGQTVPGDVDAGFELMDQVGWNTIVDRARRGLASAPPDAVLGGFSMGVGVIGELWPERTAAAAVVCFHAPTSVPDGVRTGTPVQVHVAAGDRFAPADQARRFRQAAVRRLSGGRQTGWHMDNQAGSQRATQLGIRKLSTMARPESIPQIVAG
jgi:dienelactone hydrolase